MVYAIQNLAIIGLGSIGRKHLRLSREFRPDLKIILVRSGLGNDVTDEEAADKVVYSIKEAVSLGIQAAIIASPSVNHLQDAKKILNSGVHVLVEKPLSNSMDGVNEVLNIFKKQSDIVGLTGYCMRYDPSALYFNEMFKNEEIGRVLHAHVECSSYLPEWRSNIDYHNSVSAQKELGGGALLELSHELDYLEWFFGPFKSVTALLHNSGTLGLDVEESTDLILKTVEGYQVSVHLDFNSRIARRKCLVRCSQGNLSWDALKKFVIWQPVNGSKKIKKFTHDSDEMYRIQIKHFFDCMEKNEKPMITFEDGAKSLLIIHAAIESSISGKTIFLT